MAKNRLLSGQVGAFAEDMRLIINHNLRDDSVSTTQFDAVTGTTGATLTNVVGLVSDTLRAATQYKFRIHLAGTATTNCGLKVGLKQNNGLTLTQMEATSQGFTAAAAATQHSTSTTDAASLFASTTAVIKCVIEGTFTVGVAGTIQLQAAQNAAHADTTSVYVGSFMTLEEVLVTG